MKRFGMVVLMGLTLTACESVTGPKGDCEVGIMGFERIGRTSFRAAPIGQEDLSGPYLMKFGILVNGKCQVQEMAGFHTEGHGASWFARTYPEYAGK
jgi:hypothetical protein